MELLRAPVAVLGLGATGRSVMDFLQAQGVNALGLASHTELVDLSVNTLVISPGVPRSLPVIQQLLEQGCDVIGDIELFSRFINQLPEAKRPKIAAVTGSNGKSTVVTLLCDMARSSGFTAEAAGNIGLPVLELLTQDKLPEVLVLELSSFQLESLSSLYPDTACVLNVSEDHLDRYRDFEHYRQTKLLIYQHARHILVNRDDPLTGQSLSSFGLTLPEPGTENYGIHDNFLVRGTKPLIAVSELGMPGWHNAANALATLAMGEQLGLSMDAMLSTLRVFSGLEHRCQRVHESRGVRWLNDSKATNVGATLAALEGLAGSYQGKLHLIAGGDGKGADFSPLKSVFTHQVNSLICLGRDGAQLAALKPGAHRVVSLREAVTLAAELAQPGDIVLLSPACASLDMFKNYQQRGQLFAELSRELG